MYLNLDDTLFILDIRNYINDYDEEYQDDSWCKVSIIVKNNFFRYKRIMSELLLSAEVDNIKESLKKLLNNDMPKIEKLEFIEPDLNIVLYPEIDKRRNGKYLYIDEDEKIKDIYLKLHINLTGPYNEQKYILILYREDIQKLYNYLNSKEIEYYIDEDYYEYFEEYYSEKFESDIYYKDYERTDKKIPVKLEFAESIFDDVIITRGTKYYNENKVNNIERINNIYFANVCGNDSYTVSIKIDEDKNILDLNCTCPCDFFCKHEYATILEIRNNKTLEKLICPKCNSENIAKILWGMPRFTNELKQNIKNKKIVLGGCIINGDDPEFQCMDCTNRFIL